MTQEEKAKAYDEALERARIWQNHLYDTNDRDYADELNYIFPELKESEDEKIRKRIIHALHGDVLDMEETTKAIAWLEKQAPSDEDEIVKGIRRSVAISLMNHIDANSKGMCLSNMECEDIENAIVNEDWDKVYAYMRKKLGKQGEQKSYSWKPSEEQFEALDYAYNSCPDTERGNYYEGVLESLIEDLHRLEKQGEQNLIMAKSPQLGEQKPVWSDEDERNMQNIDSVLFYDKTLPEDTCVKLRNFLKSLRPQPKQEWSKEDERILDALVTSLNNEHFTGRLETLKGIGVSLVIDWLKSLKERIKDC